MSMTVLVDVIVRAVAAALLHSLWQGALVAGITALLWRALRGSRPNVRYVLGCVANGADGGGLDLKVRLYDGGRHSKLPASCVSPVPL